MLESINGASNGAVKNGTTKKKNGAAKNSEVIEENESIQEITKNEATASDYVVKENNTKGRNTRNKFKDIDRPRPIDRSRPFEFDELFFSVTDHKSVITYSNDVFVRISGYEAELLDGQLHKLIRHPDMPRAVFKVFWDILKAGKPVAAYVKNMAADGAYYWVMALAFPCNNGYLSIRLKPGSRIFSSVKKIYAETLKLEKEKERELDARKAMELSEEFLLSSLRSEGFESYEKFMWSALKEEMRNREKKLELSSNQEKIKQMGVPAVQSQLQVLLGELFENLKSLENLNQMHSMLMDQAGQMLKLTQSIQLFSMNTQISTSKLENSDKALSIAAENMGNESVKGEKNLLELQQLVNRLKELLDTLNFKIITTKLKVEMINDFMDSRKDSKSQQGNSPFLLSENEVTDLLFDTMLPDLKIVSEGLKELPVSLRKLRGEVNGVDRFLDTLKFNHIIGKVEIARLNEEAASYSSTFETLAKDVLSAQEKLGELAQFLSSNEKMTQLLTKNEYEIKNFYLKLLES